VGPPLAAEHPQQVVRADLPGYQRVGDPQHVRPVRGDLGQVHLVASQVLQRPVLAGLHSGHLRPPEPLVVEVLEARREVVAQHREQPEHHVEYEALSVATISGFTPASRFNSASRMCRESRGMPGTTICPMPATWSFTPFSQVMPRLKW
jgi:hypothetical protein